MNTTKFTLVILFSTISSPIISMDLPAPVDREKFKADQHQIMSALETVDIHYGEQEHTIDSAGNRDIFLKKFKGTWSTEAFSSTLNYKFDSYMAQAGIDADWMEKLHNEQNTAKKTIVVKDFVKLVADRFNSNLAKYDGKNK